LDRVGERLERALEDASAAASTGIVSRRECSYRFIPPTDENGPYTAEVTIRTTTAALAPARTAPKSPAADNAATKTAGDDLPLPNGKRRILPASRQRKEEKFLLIYKDDKWTLAAEPQQELERLFFEYALKD
jgi:hypothetical protein